MLLLLSRKVSTLGYQVLQARNGLEALRMAEQDPPDLIITDVGLPGLDGIGLARRLQSDRRFLEVPIIAITGGDRGEEALAAGCFAVLRKPLDFDLLESTLESALGSQVTATSEHPG